ncbi:MAG: hypothetical protein J0I84_20965 [Terrimonas sp.]|uniref:hypothetical protein n=1 Tax=Terrimonas sp. TaxID=1914338 RepID=UPI00092C0454|nr:hypothetical protein [Terrimonas sp.]MBN8789560.1 hypothetical protein [Terrimonas sp.]OJY92915.1 MAG: hypothetical protein BGP13_21220 [Sphingobacteriales bacterium 40-81]PVD54222.1 hypothetical protein DC498_02250 [Terrimonas sp.]
MPAKLRSLVFIDTLVFELGDEPSVYLKAILKDETGKVCSMLETKISPDQKTFSWKGLNDLPYGVYILEISNDKEALRMRLVKRI